MIGAARGVVEAQEACWSLWCRSNRRLSDISDCVDGVAVMKRRRVVESWLED